jgi:hypothetical protein
MHKSLLTISFLLIYYSSASQVLISIILGDKLNTGKIEFGLEGGANWSTIKGLDGAQTLPGFNLGFYFDIKLKNPSWMINTGVIVKSPMGANKLPVYSLNNDTLDQAFAGGHIKRKLRYFNVPVLIKYKFRNNLFIKGGIQLGLRYKAFDEFHNTILEKDDLKYKLSIKDQLNTIDAGIAFGLGYRFLSGNGMNLIIQYYYGLTDIMKDDLSPAQYNRVFYLTAGIPIGKNPKGK